MTMGSSTVGIPRAFSWLLPAQGFVAAVVIYASIYVFNVGRIPFILAVVAAGMHFLLGIYLFFAGNKPGSHHLYVIPAWLIACAGVWAGTLYYFASVLDVLLKFPALDDPPNQPLWGTWVKVGTATAAFNVVLDFITLGTFIMGALRQTSHSAPQISAPVYASPPVAQQQQYAPQQQYPQYPQQQFQQNQQNQHFRQPSQQFQQNQFPHNQQYQQNQQFQSPYPYQQQQQQHHQSAIYPPPSTVSPVSDFKASTPPTSTASPVANSNNYTYDRLNRIDVTKRLCSLQHPDGHWDYSEELAELVKLWGGRDLMAPAHGATALTHACLADMCNYVWDAQRDGREHEALSSAEVISLQAVNWDLSWAKAAMDRATMWMNGYR